MTLPPAQLERDGADQGISLMQAFEDAITGEPTQFTGVSRARRILIVEGR